MERTESAPPSYGTIDDVATRLARWSRVAPQGVARVEYTSEAARQQVVCRLREALGAVGIPFSEIELPVEAPPSQIVHALIARYAEIGAGVVSITGFATAFPTDAPLVDSLRVLNFNRENLLLRPLRQIWWMSPCFAQEFLQSIPDLDSWTMPKLRLLEAGYVRSDVADESVSGMNTRKSVCHET